MPVILFGPKPKETRRVWYNLRDGTKQQAIEHREVRRAGHNNWYVGRWDLLYMAGRPTHRLKSAFHYVRRRQLGKKR